MRGESQAAMCDDDDELDGQGSGVYEELDG